jgi:hypothetical protein
MNFSSQKHYSDECLLAWLDGETSRRVSARIEKHLKSCWDCRSRCDELNEQAIALASLMRITPFPGIRAEVDARDRLRARIQAYELQTAFKSDLSRASLRVNWIAGGLAAAVATVLVAGFILTRTIMPTLPISELSRATQEERTTLNAAGVLHQVVNVQFTGDTPNAEQHNRQMEIWNDRPGQRFSATVTSGRGGVEYAVWHPSAGRSFETGPARRVSSVPLSTTENLSLADCLSSSSNTTLAEAFETWIRKRPWRPIALAQDFARFVGPNRNTLQAKRQVEGGKEYVLLTAQRQIQGHAVEMSLLVDAATFKPAMQRLTLVSGKGKSEISLALRSEVQKTEDVPLSDFNPDERLLASNDTDSSEGVDALEAHEGLYSEEVLTLKALEDLGVKRPNIIELLPSVDGYLLLRIVVPTEERREQLYRDLTKDRPYLKVEAQLSPPEVTPKSAVVTPQLSAAFVDSWDKAYSEDLELIDLNNRFNESRISNLSTQARATLKGIVEEHLDLLKSNLRMSANELGISAAGNPSVFQNRVAESSAVIHGVPIDEFFAGMDKVDDQLQLIQNPETSAQARAEALSRLPLLLQRSLAQLPQLRSEMARHLDLPDYRSER